MARNSFKPIQQPDGIFNDADSRSSSLLSSTTDDRETPLDNDYNSNNKINNNINSKNATNLRSEYKRHRAVATDNCNSQESDSTDGRSKYSTDPKFLLRRSSSAMRVRELREVLSNMTSSSVEQGKEEAKVSGSQNARLLVASQQRLVSRLQDLRHELDSMDNEVARVRADIMNSRRYFSAMTGNRCGPDWPQNRWMDSTYSSPTMSFLSRSSDVSPYNSDDSTSTRTNNSASPFQSLQHFEDTSGSKCGQLSRSVSCSSFLSWRSDVELAGVFPEEPVPLHVSPQKPFAQYNGVKSCIDSR